MNQEKYIQDLADIKNMMQKSSRFISLSGMSGVIAGVTALAAAYMAYQTVYAHQDYLAYRVAHINFKNLVTLLLIAGITFTFSVGMAILLTTRKARKNNQKLWDVQTKLLLVNMAIPLVSGGILCLMLLFKGFVALIAPLTLLFYGLALVNASKYTFTEVRSLGIAEIILGLTAIYFIGYGLIFWAIGFGVLHIAYGIKMHMKYGS